MDRKYYKANRIVSHLLMNFDVSETPLLSRSLTYFPVLHPPWRQSPSQKHSEFLRHLAWSLFVFNFPRFLRTNPTWCTHYWTACYLRLLNSDITTQWPEPCQVDFGSQKYMPKSQHRLCKTMNRFGVLTYAPRLHNAQFSLLLLTLLMPTKENRRPW